MSISPTAAASVARFMWMFMTCLAIVWPPMKGDDQLCAHIPRRERRGHLTASRPSLCSSLTRKIMSNRDKIVVAKSMFSPGVFMSSYRPKIGFAAARTDVRELRMVVIPALAIEMV